MSDKPLVSNPNDEEQLAKAEEREKIRERIRADAWRAVLSTADGRQVVQEVLQRTGVYSNPYDSMNSHNTDFKCGEMNVGQWLLKQIDVFHADALWQMKREETKRMEAT
ncbi:MAG TPA: hypothetical protein VG457_04780 [Planctomycetota bacterium]|jgi:hypothetical protein|nr:hypothetical protein [Planctomycetota bacterium]